jgi:type II secretory ATPase GspE/PulE/Tfp pilus assembly ATPase PilB-like protein
MGIEPYMLRSGILAIISQRLVRRLCDCAVPGNDPADALGLPVARCRVPSGCPRCDRSGYQGRTLLAEALTLTTPALVAAVLARADVQQLERLAAESGNPSLWQRGLKAVEEGITSPAEIRRVLGTPA